MSVKVSNVVKEVLELQRDSLLMQVAVVEKNLVDTLPFTESRTELMKLYLCIDDNLNDVNIRLDEILKAETSKLDKKLGDSTPEEALNV